MKTCWNCKFFTRTGGHGSYDWGYCNITNNSVDSDLSCDKFVSKEEMKKVNYSETKDLTSSSVFLL